MNQRFKQNYVRQWATIPLLTALTVCGGGGWGQKKPPKPGAPVRPASAPPEMVFAGGEGSIRALAFAPDGKSLACTESGHSVKIYDVASTELVRVLKEEAPVGALAYSPDGKVLAAGAGRKGEPLNGVPQANAAVRLWNPQTGQPDGVPLDFPAGKVRRTLIALAFSPDGKTLAAGTDTYDLTESKQVGELTLWDMTTRKIRLHLAAHERQTGALAFSPDGSLLASGGGDGIIKLWSLATGEVKQSLKPPIPTAPITCLAFLPGGQQIVSSGDYGGSGNVWEVATGTLLRRNFGGGYAKFVLLDGGKTAVFTSRNGPLLWDVATGRASQPLTSGDGNALAVTADGTTLATGAGDGSIRLWNVEPGAERGRLLGVLPGVDSIPQSVSISPDGSLLALGGPNGVRLWDTHRAALRHLLTAPSGSAINRSAFSPDSSLLIAATGGGVQMWETQGGLLLHTFAIADGPGSPAELMPGLVREVAFAPDGGRFGAGGGKQVYRLWNARTFALERTLSIPGVPTYVLDFSPDSSLLATGDMIQQGQERTNRIRILDVRTGETKRTLNDPRDKNQNGRFLVPRPHYLPNTTLLATWAFGDNTVLIWNTVTGQVVRQLDMGEETLTGIAVSADGARLTATGVNGGLCLWDVATGKKLKEWRGHDGQVTGSAFAPNGKSLYTVSVDRTVKVWSIPDGKLRGTLRFFSTRDSRIANAWIFTTPEGFYTASTGAEALFQFQVNGQLLPASRFKATYNRPEMVQKLLTP